MDKARFLLMVIEDRGWRNGCLIDLVRYFNNTGEVELEYLNHKWMKEYETLIGGIF